MAIHKYVVLNVILQYYDEPYSYKGFVNYLSDFWMELYAVLNVILQYYDEPYSYKGLVNYLSDF
ncbi:MAG: hypothetical protein IPL69_14670 [Saprospiraceae bacterium]|nr:hypothetical protein [Candidatus Brachybacter algidus]